jgi:hypothetical protein
MISAVVKLMLQRADDVALYRPKGNGHMRMPQVGSGQIKKKT